MIPLRAEVGDPPGKLRLLQQSCHVLIARVAAPLIPDLQKPARLAHGANHGLCPVQRIRHHLLAVHVQSRLKAGDRLLGMYEVGRGHQHRIEPLLAIEHLAVVFVFVHLVLIEFEVVLRRPPAVLPNVANGAEAKPRNSHGRGQEHAPLLACTEQGYFQDVVLRGRCARRIGELQHTGTGHKS